MNKDARDELAAAIRLYIDEGAVPRLKDDRRGVGYRITRLIQSIVGRFDGGSTKGSNKTQRRIAVCRRASWAWYCYKTQVEDKKLEKDWGNYMTTNIAMATVLSLESCLGIRDDYPWQEVAVDDEA